MMRNDCENKFVIENPVYLKIRTKSYDLYTYDSVLYVEFMPDWVRITYLDSDGDTIQEDVFPRTEIVGVFAKSNSQNIKAAIVNAQKEAYML